MCEKAAIENIFDAAFEQSAILPSIRCDSNITRGSQNGRIILTPIDIDCALLLEYCSVDDAAQEDSVICCSVLRFVLHESSNWLQ